LSATWRGVECGRNRRINPMLLDMHRAKRCGARTRSGKLCQSPAMANGAALTGAAEGKSTRLQAWTLFSKGYRSTTRDFGPDPSRPGVRRKNGGLNRSTQHFILKERWSVV
jgi:hypothetical protein